MLACARSPVWAPEHRVEVAAVWVPPRVDADVGHGLDEPDLRRWVGAVRVKEALHERMMGAPGFSRVGGWVIPRRTQHARAHKAGTPS
jgi:hypothetical protein